MSIFSGWLKNANGDYVAPKTKTDLVLNDDGSTLKDSLDALGDVTLLATHTTTSDGTYTITNLNNFRYIVLVCDWDSNMSSNPVMLPVSIFKSLNRVLTRFYSKGQALEIGATAFYISDTQVKLSNIQSGDTCYFYGVK